MKKALGYIRVSSNGQIDKSGLDRQKEAIEAYAKQNGYNLTEIIEDAGISGTLYDREGLSRLFQHTIKTVIIEDLSRLGRDLLISEKIILTLKDNGFTLISCKEGSSLLDDNPSRILVRQLLGSVAQFEKGNLVARLKVSRERIRKQLGKCEGEKSLQETKPDTFKAIKQLYKPRKGYGRRTMPEIAEEMNRRGFTTKRGLPFKPSNVYRVLHP